MVRNFAAIFSISIALCTAFGQSANAQLLLNVDLGAGGGRDYSVKSGPAALGQAANNFWNFYDRDISSAAGDWRSSAALVNLHLASGAATTIGVNISDAPGAWGDASGDPMYQTYDYPLDGGNNVVTFTNLPAGSYDVLAYSADGNYEVTVGGTSYGVKTTADPAVSSVPVWTEGVQYARFRNVVVATGQPLVLTVRNGVGGYAILSGVQILGNSAIVPLAIVAQPAPKITVQPLVNSGTMQLTWPISTGTFQVQSANSPLGPWVNEPLTTATNGANAMATVVTTHQQQYFRLVEE